MAGQRGHKGAKRARYCDLHTGNQIGHKWAKWAITDMKRQKNIKTEDGLGKVHQLFGAEWPKVMEELNRELAA